MILGELIELIQAADQALKRRATAAVDRSLVVRNWLVGMHVVEFEQHGEDRARYGEALLATIAARLLRNKAKGFSETNLRLFRQFYRTYHGIRQTLSDELATRLPLSWSHYAFPASEQDMDDTGRQS